jgi:RHS repeat-associated protein
MVGISGRQTGQLYLQKIGVNYMQARYYDPVIGRFYSNDPVGFKNVHNFNRYAYARNNPYKYIDPDGRDATIVHNKNGSININIATKFSGSGATPSNISSVKSQISKTWSGSYNIDGKATDVVVSVTEPINGGQSNNITLVDGPTSDTKSEGESFVDSSSGNNMGDTGEFRVDGANLTDGSVSHEAGHLMGASDKYGGGKALPGYSDNIMGNAAGKPDDRNMREIIKSDENIHKGN